MTGVFRLSTPYLRLQPCTHLVDGLILNSGNTIAGCGPSSIMKLQNPTSGAVVTVASGADSVTLKNLTIDCAGASFGVFAPSSANLVLSNVHIKNSSSVGLYAVNTNPNGGADRTTLRNCKFTNCGGGGAQFARGAKNISVTGCFFLSNGSDGLAFLSDGLSDGIIVQGNTFLSNAANGAAVYAVTNQGPPVSVTWKAANVCVSDNYAASNVSYGLLVQANQATITGNRSFLNGKQPQSPNVSGILCNSGAATVTGNTCNGNFGDGIDMGLSVGFSCTGNTCNNNGYYGIELSGVAQGSVSANRLAGNFASNPSFIPQCGLYHGPGFKSPYAVQPDRVNIFGNSVQTGPFQAYGIYIDAGTTNFAVTNNIATGSGSLGDIHIAPTGGMVASNL